MVFSTCFLTACVKRLLLVAGLLSALVAQAQHSGQDFVVTNAGDTLRGRVQLSGRAAQLITLHTADKSPVTFTAAQLRSYGMGYTVLRVSRQVGAKGAARLLTPLVRGYVSLYGGQDSLGQVRYYLQPIDSTHVVEVVPGLAQLTYARLLPGCSSLDIGGNEFRQQYPYTTSGLTRLVTTFNQCRQQPTELVRVPSGIQASFGVKAGLNYASLRLGYDDYSHQVYESSHSAALGYQVGLVMLLRTRSQFSLQLEGNYVHVSGNYGPAPPPSYNSGIYLGTYAVRIRYSQLQVPLLLRYTLGQKQLAPYLSAGPSLGVTLGNSSVRSVYDVTGTTATDAPFAASIQRVTVGAAAGAGLLWYRNGRPTLSVEGRCDYVIVNNDLNLSHQLLRIEAGRFF